MSESLPKPLQAITAELDALRVGVDCLFDRCGTALPSPTKLFHFTDCGGLVEILRTQRLWASLASSLNDVSEVQYAIDRMEMLIDAGTIKLKHLPRQTIADVWAGKLAPEGITRDFRAYVTSFCAAADVVHWLHYGRSGTGVAIELDTAALQQVPQFTLCPVLYDLGEQDRTLSELATLVDDSCGRLKTAVSDSGQLRLVSAYLLLSYLRLLAPRMKAPAFKAENEWRLVSQEAWKDEPAEDPTRETHFRVASGRIVPYKEIQFDPLPLVGITLGFSCPMGRTEQAISVLMENSFKKLFPVSVSAVAVRP